MTTAGKSAATPGGLEVARRTLLFGMAAMLAGPMPASAAALEMFAPVGQSSLNHDPFDRLLKRYVSPDGEHYNQVNYLAFRESGHRDLQVYIATLAGTDPSSLSRDEAHAYWINLYNAKTLDIVLDHYPVASIRDIDLGGGFFTRGPWSEKVLTINGIDLSLNDIEHRIVRAIFKDVMSHYGLNCASYSCPNLAVSAYAGSSIADDLTRNARDYINHRRAIYIRNRRIVASKIFSWYADDFGGAENLKVHWQLYASPALAAELESAEIDGYKYDWSLNDA
jgi:hypothetical protein